METPISTKAAIVPVLSLLLDDEESIDPTLPLANAGPDAEVIVGELVQLDGSASTDPTGQALSFSWSFLSKPSTSSATLSSEVSVTPEFVLDVPGSYEVQLVVHNGIKDSLPDTVIITNTNRAPIADAGTNSIVPLNQAVQLDGSDSSDIDGDPFTYLWTMTERPASSNAAFLDAAVEKPQFTPDLKGNYVASLIVNDGLTDSVADQVEVLAGVELVIDVADVFFGLGRETTATLRLNFPAPSQGVTISLNVDESIISLAETQIVFAEDEIEKTFTLTGLAKGVTDLSASGINIDEVSVTVEVSGVLISIDEIAPLSPSASRSVAISLSDAAPLGGVTIDLEALNTAIATVAPTSFFIAEGQFTPTQNAQVMGIALGKTKLRATGPGFAPDERAIEVALSAEFDPVTLSVPETLDRDIVLKLDAPAPTGGVTFDLSIEGDQIFSMPGTTTIEAGQTQTQPITLTGLTEGVAVLRASADDFIDSDATITVVDAPNIFVSRNGSNSHLNEAEIGVGLQNSYRFRLEVTPTSAVDIRASVPTNSGVLLSNSSNTVGSDVLIIEDVISTTSPFFTIQGIELGDDVPITIEAFQANNTALAGYEALPTSVDIDPSGVFASNADFTITTFTSNRVVGVRTGVLYDNENVALEGSLHQIQQVRSGTTLKVPMQVDNSNLLTLSDGASGNISINGGNASSGTIAVTPVASGVATVSIANQPAPDFNLPSDRDDNVQITITAPKAFLKSPSSNSHLAEAIVGLDLQRVLRVGLESAAPAPVDIQISVPANAGVGLSTDSSLAGSTQILLEDISGSQTPPFYVQGLAVGDDVPISIAVFNANTNNPAGFNELASTVDVDPSGIYLSTSDYSTTTFSNDRDIQIQTALLFDAETPNREGDLLTTQSLRGGLTLVVPMETSDANIVSLPAGATDNLSIQGGVNFGRISVSPKNAGQTTLSIASLPGGFALPNNLDDNVIVTVTAANAFLRSLGSASHLVEAKVGIDLQSPHSVRLAATPPAPVDITISVPANSGVLLSGDPMVSGGTSLVFEDVFSTNSPNFYIQGTNLGDDVAVSIDVNEANTTTPIGYNILASTVDIDPSGVYMSTGDYQTNTFAPNRTITAFSALLYDDEDIFLRDGQYRINQVVRGGIDLNVALAIDDDTVAVLPAGANDTLVILSGQSNGGIEVDPQTAGVASVSITSQPNANFSLPTNRDDEVEITVTAPNAGFVTTNLFVGDELQIPIGVFLAENPPNPVDVTVDINAPAIALISKDGSISGSGGVTFENVTSAAVGTIFVQGLTLNGATQIKVSAPGYNDGTANVEVVPSGFRLSGNFSNIDTGNTRDLLISSARLNPNGTFSAVQQVRGGTSFDILTNSSLPSVGSVTSPVTISGGNNSSNMTFTAISPGTTNIQITQPTDFTPPVGEVENDITVE